MQTLVITTATLASLLAVGIVPAKYISLANGKVFVTVTARQAEQVK